MNNSYKVKAIKALLENQTRYWKATKMLRKAGLQINYSISDGLSLPFFEKDFIR